MRMRNVVLASAAPAAIVVGYAVLTGYLLSRVRPVPITTLPRNAAGREREPRELIFA